MESAGPSSDILFFQDCLVLFQEDIENHPTDAHLLGNFQLVLTGAPQVFDSVDGCLIQRRLAPDLDAFFL